MLKMQVVAPVTVPLIVPVDALSVSPEQRLPDETDQSDVGGFGVQPDVPSVCVYGTLIVPPGKLPVVMVQALGVAVITTAPELLSK